MKILHLHTDTEVSSALAHLPHHQFNASSISALRTEVMAYLPFWDYDKYLVTGANLQQVMLEFSGIYTFEKGDPYQVQNYSGFWYQVLGNWCLNTFNATDQVTCDYQKRHLERFDEIPYVPAINVEVVDVLNPECTSDIVLDIETTGLDPFKDQITSIQVYYPQFNEVAYIDTDITLWIPKLYEYIRASDCRVIGHNLMFDLAFLSASGGEDFFEQTYLVDTLLYAKARGLHHASLKHLAAMYSTYHPNAYKQAASYNKEYAIVDTLATWDVYQRLIRRGVRDIDVLSSRALAAFGRARLAGMKVDTTALDTTYREMQNKADSLLTTLKGYADIEWSNNGQVTEALKSLGVPLTKTTAGGALSISADVLSTVENTHQAVALLLEWRKLTKLISTFYATYKSSITTDHPFIHPTIQVLGADTGRTSCRGPNIQQVPKVVKRIFTSRYPGGEIGQFDLAQSELRCAVWLSGDKALAEALQQDAHKVTASAAFGVPIEEVSVEQRQAAKAVNFASIYGASSAKNLASRVGSTEEAIQACFDAVKIAYPKLVSTQGGWAALALQRLRSVDAYGKIRDFRYSMQYGGRGAVRREAFNTPIQALSAYICLELSCYISEALQGAQSLVIMQIHDSVFVDVHPDEKDLVTGLCTAAFRQLNHIPQISSLPGWGLIPCSGGLSFNVSMYEESQDEIPLSS